LPLKLLIDESLDNRIQKKLKIPNFDVILVSDYSKGISDYEILQLSRELNSIVITEDRDFGEWIFAHGEKNVSVVYLRYNARDLDKITGALLRVLIDKGQNLYGRFVVITPKKVRIRDIF